MESFDISRPPKDQLSGDLLSHQEVDSCVMPLYSLNINKNQQQLIQNCAEALGRHISRRVNVERGTGIGASLELIGTPTAEAQHMIYDLYETYYQGTYKTLSALAALTAAFPQAFGNLPARSMKKFLEAVQRESADLGATCQELEKARQYRNLLDHPAGAQTYDWITHNKYDGHGIVVLHCGAAGRTGNIPEGAHRVKLGDFPLQADWVFDPPFVLDVDRSLRLLANWIFGRLKSFLAK